MGRGIAATPDAFSLAISGYARKLVREAGGDASGRWLASRLTRGVTYYRDRLVGEKIFDTKDVGDLARLFDMSPATFIRQAMLAEPEPELAPTVIQQQVLHQ